MPTAIDASKDKPKIHIVCGATASGKSAKAMQLAADVPGVIINADSQQLYADLRVITARPSDADEARVPHKLYGTQAGDEPANVAKWLRMAMMEIDWARSQGLVPYVVGGTGMYLGALMNGIAEIPDIPLAVRDQAEQDCEHMGCADFHARLAAVDPEAAAGIAANDRQRLIRAYSVWLGTAKTLTYWQTTAHQHAYNADDFTITHVQQEREALYARCDARVLAMLAGGALAEVEHLLSLGYDANLPIMRVIGVPELSQVIGDSLSLEQATLNMQQATRQYAKRQLTWFRNKL